jgi:hypothetical protein
LSISTRPRHWLASLTLLSSKGGESVTGLRKCRKCVKYSISGAWPSPQLRRLLEHLKLLLHPATNSSQSPSTVCLSADHIFLPRDSKLSLLTSLQAQTTISIKQVSLQSTSARTGSDNSKVSAVIVVGGGLSGLSAAHTIYQRGGNVLVLDKNGL